jgi:hypothetical protein
MTPPRMVELQCPVCQGQHWVIDSDFRGTSGQDIPREEREYVCSKVSVLSSPLACDLWLR